MTGLIATGGAFAAIAVGSIAYTYAPPRLRLAITILTFAVVAAFGALVIR